ncbi:MAG: phage tail protein [Steroidobacteraceae bacterium]
MSDQFLGEIRIFAGNFAPRGWLLCNGQVLPISQYTALFSLLGTNYGGDGKTNFALPNLQGSFPLNQGQGPGLTSRLVGETGGESAVTLLVSQIPAHSHNLLAAAAATTGTAGPTVSLAPVASGASIYHAATSLVGMDPASIGTTGGGSPHNNLQPYLVLNFIIATTGIFPSRS